MQPEEAPSPTREDIERGLLERGWTKMSWVREGGPSVFEQPETHDIGYCFVTDDHICMIEFPSPGATDWAPIGQGLEFLKERHPK